MPPQNLPRVSQGEMLQISESKGRSTINRGPFAPWLPSGFVLPNVRHYEDRQ